MRAGASSVASRTFPARGRPTPNRNAATRLGSGCSPSTRRPAGRGIGRALAQACIDRARAEGRSGVAILTRPSRPVAQGLYTSLGFVRDTSRDIEYDPGRWLWSFVLTFDEAT